MPGAAVYLKRRACCEIIGEKFGSGQLKRETANGLVYYRHAAWANLRHGVFTRHGGVSAPPWHSLNLGASVGDAPAAVAENRRRLLDHFGLADAAFATLWLVHGADVLRLDAPPDADSHLTRADALITDRPQLPLLLRFADCLPLLLYDPARAAIGIAHAGWRGTAAGVATQCVSAMREAYGCQPEDIQALIGPAICGACYEVGEEVIAAMRPRFDETELADIARPSPAGRWLLDLPAANRCQLRRAGLRQIHEEAPCTACNTADFFSHRAEGGRTGRFGALICL